MEHIHTPRLENVRLVDRFASKKAVKGTLHLTATHLIFIENSGNKETWILHNHISSVEKQATCPTGCPLLISCKTFQLITLILPRERDGHQLYNSLLKLSQPDNYDQVYAFLYNPRSSETDRAAGWDLLSAQDDYERMGLPNAAWHCTHVNYKYKVCSTYPEDVYTPITVSVPILVASAKFRSKNRLPALSQLLPNGAALCRCSQPLSGFSARCEEDERLLQAIRLANPNCNYLYVVDTRPKINALANRAAGKGYENEDNYTNVRFRFVGIDNIHVMRSSLQRLLEACQAQCITVSAFLSGLEASGWLRHIKTVTDTTVFIAKALWEEGASVLVHCSDGWDRTAQVCSLSAVILHPYYRTTRGFMTVIEKEWIKFGHKFAQRCGHLEGDIKETSPVFLQFLETVWQLAQQFPSAFEFGEELLIQLHHHTTSCQFGNFLGNCDNNRQMLRVRDRTYSVWAHLWDQRDTFANPHYRPNNNAGPIWPNTAACNFTFWRGMYNHFETSLQPRQSYLKALTAMQKRCNELEQEVDQLEDRLTLLQGPRPDKAQIRRLPTSVGLNPPPPDSNPMSTPSLSPGTPQDAYAGVPNNTTNLVTLPSSSPSSSDGSSSGVDDDDDDDDFVISNGVLSCSDNSEGLD